MTRYNGIEPDDEGVYVLFEDHLTAITEAVAAERERSRLVEAYAMAADEFIQHGTPANEYLYIKARAAWNEARP